MRIVLAAQDADLAQAWQGAFVGAPDVSVHAGTIFDVEADALVSPANSFGFMDGGIDALYSERFGWDLQMRLRRLIYERHHGELLIGAAEIVETGDRRHPYLVACPTMRVPMVLDPSTINPFLATRAALLLVKHGRFPSGEPIADVVRTLAFPGMGTGVGRVPAETCARQMKAAFNQVMHGPAPLPSSWAEASELHQRLNTDRPTRLQF